MATLVNVTREGRLFLKVGAIIFSLIMIIFIFIKGGTIFRDMFFPKPPPPPLEGFGKMPKIVFPVENTQQITYTVNTIDGSLPFLGDRINIYKINSYQPNLLALDLAKKNLKSANFDQNQIKISDTLYSWNQSGTGVTIRYDIINHHFTIFSNYLTDPKLVATSLLPSEDDITRNTKDFLRSIDATSDNLDFDNTDIEYLQIQNGALVKAESLGSARFARVTIPYKKIDDHTTVAANPEKSLTTFIVSYPDYRFTILEGKFFNYEANLEEKSDYPLKSTEEAMEVLKKGNAYILNPQNLTNVDITSVELDYYLAMEGNSYLLPVYVFKGVNFEAFVEALSDSSIEANPSLSKPQN